MKNYKMQQKLEYVGIDSENSRQTIPVTQIEYCYTQQAERIYFQNNK